MKNPSDGVKPKFGLFLCMRVSQPHEPRRSVIVAVQSNMSMFFKSISAR